MNITTLESIAAAQRRLIYMLLANLLVSILLVITLANLPPSWSPQARMAIFYTVLLLLGGVATLLTLQLMRAMGERTWAIAIAAVLLFVPWVSVVVLLVVNHRATKLLRRYHLRVGMLGVSREELGRLAAALRTSRALQESMEAPADGASKAE
jgi:hypothetical protein